MTAVDSATFGRLHAAWYDRWFSARSLPAEVEQLTRIFAAAGAGVGSVLDIGCGTGGHLELLARHGLEVVGIDRSPAMVAVAGERLAGSGVAATVLESDVATLRLARAFDAAIMMSWVLSYHVSDEDLFTTLAVLHRHLRPGGLLAFDVVDGSVLLRDGVSTSLRVVEDGTTQFLRVSEPVLRPAEQVYEIGLRMWMFDGDRVVATAAETHPVRYFLPREVELILHTAGFEPLGSEPLAGGPQARQLSRLFWARRP
ncbi:class I SAM-dependent DNA methyltransferase [Actinophytocola sp.]|uniref:class I SAM-dependent DNA methyltransferase n=1 Tax=Actinophytocola sp. TaxID=1872138 RepID=UPI002D804D06|nr:methyltransferase domain-containing protein [Actinophytocola sp.]HET9144251.1 methyltransferase domain-containing protein [Actinophytocola sp.]HEU5111237.1 methyltransferase domain-containing protein [Micromonosporaceae bacterium]